MKRLNKKTKALIFFNLLFFAFSLVLAQEVNYFPIPRFPIAPTSGTPLPIFVKYLFNFGVITGGVIAFGVLIWAGISYLTSSGNVEKIGEAKEKARNAFIGLLILIFSYLIIVTLNPQLSILSEELEEIGYGIFLIDTSGNKYFLSDKEKKCNYSNIEKIEFSPTERGFIEGSGKGIAQSIFFFPQQDYQGNPAVCCLPSSKNIGCNSITINGHQGAQLSGASIDARSVYIFWKEKEGVYFFDFSYNPAEKTCNWKNITPHLYLKTSMPNFAIATPPFDDKTKIIDINTSSVPYYYTVVCDKPGYSGRCSFVYYPDEDLDDFKLTTVAGGDTFSLTPSLSNFQIYNNYPPIGSSTISSAILFKGDLLGASCQVAFYDKTNCQGNELAFPFWGDLGDGPSTAGIVVFTTSTPQFATGTPLFENVLSIKIKSGTCGVLLCTNGPPLVSTPSGLKASTITDAGSCQFFRKPDNGSACIPTLVGSAVYESKLEDPAPGYQTKKVRWIRIIPYERIEE